VSVETKTITRVLIADDDDVMREKVKRILRGLYFQITEASSGTELKKLIETERFDCVLLDNHLGDADGLDLIPIINPMENSPCPIVMITGVGDEKVIVEAMRRGAYDYINKSNLQADYLINVISAGLKWADVEAKLRDSQKKLHYLSMYDSLTSLPNRQLFLDRLEHVVLMNKRDKSPFAVLMMDLNLFKEVNDTYGHAAGDELLIQVAARLKGIARDSDTFARLGGDEFAGILYNMRSLQDACNVAEKINNAIDMPFRLQNETVSIAVSIGIAFVDGKDVDLNSLLAQADNSMYEAKKRRLGYMTYQNDEYSQKNPSLMIASCLKEALNHDEFYMVYQPQIDLVTGECCGLEALARWESPVLGTIPPDVFISIAERSEVITRLSYATFEMVFKQINDWQKEGLQIPVSINLSTKLLEDKSLINKVIELLSRYGMDAHLITFEITETALMHNPKEAGLTIQRLSDLGVNISIDDFGTGFTSFSHLRHFALNELKIDKLFIKDLRKEGRDSSIVSSLVSLASGFGIKLIAEGVEDADKLTLLKDAGCMRAQGYWFSRPMEGSQVLGWIHDWRANLDENLQDKVAIG
jgi:diguanylate cyclase